MHLLIAVTGSVAATKLPLLLDSFIGRGVTVRLVTTTHARHFFDEQEVAARHIELFSDENEWSEWKTINDPVLHIELRKWAEVMLIAPLDANTLAKLAAGMCDNLVTCIVRAWDLNKPLFYCPAMNTMMWDHPLTAQHISRLDEFRYRQIPPVVKKLACGDFGNGAMAAVETIVQTVMSCLTTGSEKTSPQSS